MKKTIAILLILVIGMVGVFAAPASALPTDNGEGGSTPSTETAKITVTTTVAQFASFGVTAAAVDNANFATKALFDAAVGTTLSTAIDMLDLGAIDSSSNPIPVEVGKLSGINNTIGAVTLSITTTDLEGTVGAAKTAGISGAAAKVALTVLPTSVTIGAATNSAFGTLKNQSITVKETTPGSAALAPAGGYEATITIQVTTP